MKKLLLSLVITVASTGFAISQTAEEIVANYLEAIGGEETWRNVESTIILGKINTQGMDISFESYSKAPNLEYTESSIMGKTIVEAFNGESVWRINPFMGGDKPQLGTEEESEKRAQKAFENKYIGYADKGHTIELLENEEAEGTICYVVKMVEANGDESKTYFDTETYLPVLISVTIADGGDFDGTEMRTIFSDYNEVDGVVMAYYSETKMNGNTTMSMTVESVELNAEISYLKFEMPSDEEE